MPLKLWLWSDSSMQAVAIIEYFRTDLHQQSELNDLAVTTPWHALSSSTGCHSEDLLKMTLPLGTALREAGKLSFAAGRSWHWQHSHYYLRIRLGALNNTFFS